jgi:hypothetical protein
MKINRSCPIYTKLVVLKYLDNKSELEWQVSDIIFVDYFWNKDQHNNTKTRNNI